MINKYHIENIILFKSLCQLFDKNYVNIEKKQSYGDNNER